MYQQDVYGLCWDNEERWVSVLRSFQTEFGIPRHAPCPLWAVGKVENRPQVFSAMIAELSQMNPHYKCVISYLLPGKRLGGKKNLFQIMLLHDIFLPHKQLSCRIV